MGCPGPTAGAVARRGQGAKAPHLRDPYAIGPTNPVRLRLANILALDNRARKRHWTWCTLSDEAFLYRAMQLRQNYPEVVGN